MNGTGAGKHFRQETESRTSTANLALPKNNQTNLSNGDLYLLQYLSPNMSKANLLKIDVFNSYKEI